jgi:hypothetical protein
MLGLLYAWVVRPVTYVDTAPASLRADFKDRFRIMIASAYAANGDLHRARARLAVLGDREPAAALMQQSSREAGPGGSAGVALMLADLAQAIGASAGPTHSPSATKAGSSTPSPDPATAAQASPTRGQGSPGPSPSVAGTTAPPTITARPTLTPRPSPTATVKPGEPFALSSNEVVCDEEIPPGLLQIVVQDSRRRPIAGAEIIIAWRGGQESLFTGLKPELGNGYADYAMQEGLVYSARLAAESEIAEGLSAPSCETSEGTAFIGGLSLVYEQP